MNLIKLTIIAFLSIPLAQASAFDRDDCNKTVTCSDGTKLVTITCSESYTEVIKDGHKYIYDTGNGANTGSTQDQNNGSAASGDSFDPYGMKRHRPPEPPEDPCSSGGHGHRVDNDPNDPYWTQHNQDQASPPASPSNAKQDQAQDAPPEDPFHLKQATSRTYDPNDPYGLKQGN